jgi:ATP-dependent Clp protease ATP-binding subunit ClpC
VFERFTERARQVIVLAQDEARAFKHNYIGTEHLLLGLLREERGLGAMALGELGVTLEEARSAVLRQVPPGDEVMVGQIPFTPRAKKVMELSLRESLSLDHNYIGTEHLLLALVHEGRGVAARVLDEFDVDVTKAREVIGRLLSKPISGNPLPPRPTRVQFAQLTHPVTPRWKRAEIDLRVFSAIVAGALGIGLVIGWAIWGH